MTVKIDKKPLDKLRRVLRKQGVVRVGVLAAKGGSAPHGGDPLTMVELATIHEFGSPAANIPERSFIRRTFENRRADVEKITGRLSEKILRGEMTVGRALALLGEWGAAEVKKTITVGNQITPDIQDATKARKGSDRPLVDTGQLVNVISYQVGD